MANSFLSISDLVGDALDLADFEITDLSNAAPLFMALPFVPSSNGTAHKYVKETGAPTVGFRAENGGRDFSESADTVMTMTLKILDFSWQVDKAVADAWRKGGPQALIGREGFRHLKQAMYEFEKQVIYGTGNDSSGFAGLAQNAAFDAAADTLVVNAGGTTANTGSSCWLINAPPSGTGMAGVMIEESPFDFGDTIVQNFVDGSGKNYPVYYTPGSTWTGLQIGGAYDAVRIANLTADSGKGLTDSLIYDGLAKFPGGRKPTHILMNRRSLQQLRKSRTATNQTGAPAPIPTEVEGIPILVLESILSTEALLA